MVRPIGLTPGTLSLAVSTYVATILNASFWGKLAAVVQPVAITQWLFMAALVAALIAVSNAALSLLALRHVFKPLLVALVMISATVAYFLWEYGTAIDVNMVHNVLETDAQEIGELITWRLVGAVVVFGIVPSVLIAVTPVVWRPLLPTIMFNVARAAASVAIAALLVFATFADFVSVMRDNRGLSTLLVPSNAILAMSRYANSKEPVIAEKFRPHGKDARREAPGSDTRPLVAVLVVGETARAANFSLNGYARNTNPRLAQIDGVLSFKHVTSCGTDTAHSVPCMFSGLGQADFSVHRAAGQENLLHILRRVGLDVLWRDNQTGCKGVCRGIETEYPGRQAVLPFFDASNSFDEVLLQGLEERLTAMSRGGVVVLHMLGSHGPAYYKRIPPAFAQFQPICASRQFTSCSRAQIVNSYDNTILYTDHVLAELIGVLRAVAAKGINTAMIYVSDHGESLGEKGLYLHGMPRALAPKEQTHIPMITWFAPQTLAQLQMDTECLHYSAETRPASHDNLFHTMLGLFAISSALYDPALDIMRKCRARSSDGH
jgi:lipid A ethanolaminephosphotransferase